ncbi:hypothetical protein [Acinetobacter larvae]|uniref:Uncharacterized protein n=1 Tax=Acinetobacter larvae TaxID=1789224 RepID=A0A1B2LZ45_9GAMM|nr:hypothetical protein [Acinetobacter larvae]AOA58220.1 hypothetical protein BFG52_07555 [Acinetobacter larvae]
MALKVQIEKSKQVCQWKEYKDVEGNVLAEFQINGINNKAYLVAVERASNQINQKGFDVTAADASDKLYHELLMEAVACHLIKDWKGVTFDENGEVIEPPYSKEAAIKLLTSGDIGIYLWAFIKEQAVKIQEEANKVKLDTLGKSESSTSGKPSTES